MDQASNDEENKTPLLIDSGTESIPESPLAEEGSEHSEESTVCDINAETHNRKFKQIHGPSLLDKSFSIDEPGLCSPLEPVPISIYQFGPEVVCNGISDESNSDVSAKSDEDDGVMEDDFLLGQVSNAQKVEDSVRNLENIQKTASCDLGIDEQAGGDHKVQIRVFSTNDLENSDAELVTIPAITDLVTSDVDQKCRPNISRTSILRRPSCLEPCSDGDTSSNFDRRVSFPTEKTDLVSYREPENVCSWIICEFISAEKILQIYQSSCKKHKTIELDTIKSQIQDIKNNTDHSAVLRLNSIKITSEINETLEDLLKVTNFHSLVLNDCKFTSQTMNEFLNILEYYESVRHLEIAMNFDDEDTWKCFCNACSNIMVLESLSFKGMQISEPYMRGLLNAIRINSNITILKFDGCMLVKLPSFYLVESLMANRTIRELYLPSTGLYTKEADALQRFLVNNTHLKVLDISNNFLGDRGLEVLAKGLCKQNTPGVGLSVLVIFNNQITEKSGQVIKNIIIECKNLHTLNVGYNNLTDEVLKYISEGLAYTQSLEGLGLQCTLLTCKGILALAEAIPNNESLQKINLKGNKAIQLLGVETLCNALTSSKITKIEIDDNNRSSSDPEAYAQLVKKLHAICTVNKSYIENSDEDEEIANISQVISRRVSLSCEPRYNAPDQTTTFQIGSPALSPLPSPIPSPSPRGRFQIVKVPESNKIPPSVNKPKSRFRVTKVPPSPDEEVDVGRFANVRSSVSSNDSVDSLTTLPLESDSE